MMDFSSLLSKKEQKKKDLFWSLTIEPDWIQAGVWEIVDGTVKIISSGPATAWKTDDELVKAADSALSGAVGDLDENAPEPTKTVFGVSTSWVSKGEIKPEFLSKLKDLCTELSLKPTGFVVLPESIAHLIKTEEGSPFSGIAVGAGEENLEISVFRLGRSLGTKIVARSVSMAEDVLEGLARFPSEDPFASRFVLYDGKEGELEEIKQSVIGMDWESNEKVKFLHAPKVEIFAPDKKVLAVALAGASEMGEIKAVAPIEKKEEKEEKLVKDTKDLENLVTPEEKVSAEEVGFVVGEDIGRSIDEKLPVPLREEQKEVPSQPEIMPPQQKTDVEKKRFVVPGFISNIRNRVFGFLDSFGGKREPRVSKQKKLVVGGIILGVSVVVFFLAWWFMPKATVTIYVSPKSLDQKLSFSVDSSANEINISKKTIPGEVTKIAESGEKTKSTTGTKTVGEKAKGSVEIRNGTSSSVKLSSGTTLLSGSDLKFTLTESASVSAALSPTSPGTTTVEAEASSIGAEYNLAKDETFKVSNYPRSDVDALATADFSGGSSRQISAVSQDDIDALLEELEEELFENAESDLGNEITGDDLLISESIQLVTKSRDFSAKEGDEADTLILSLDVDAEVIIVKKDDLFKLVEESFKNEIPEGYVLREGQVSFSFDVEDEEDGVFELDTEMEVNLLPEINMDEIAKRIAGKYPPVAEKYLASIPGYSRAQIRLKPRFPGKLGTLPHVVKKIEVEVAAER